MNNNVETYCLIDELSRLKKSSVEAVENLKQFSSFKNYMHVKRTAEEELLTIIQEESEKDTASLILVCGSVGDGKSHVISYLKNQYPDVMEKFYLYNDATESFYPTKTSIDTLNEELYDFSDEKLYDSKSKLILAINLGTLSNFIDSEYGQRYSKLKQFVTNNKLLETEMIDNNAINDHIFRFVNFADYHLYKLKDGKAYSDYIKSLIDKITLPENENNKFYLSYKANCITCINNDCCPIKVNYELLSDDRVKLGIIDLLIQCIIKNKIIISTRELLNFIYEILVSRTFIEAGASNIKNKINRLNAKQYLQSLTFNLLFDSKGISYIFESLYLLDPLNVRNPEIDEFIIKFNNSEDIIEYFQLYLDYPQRYINKININDLSKDVSSQLRKELLKLFIRSYYFCGKDNLFTLKDEMYEEYISRLYNWNRGNKKELKALYDDIKEAIFKWNGETEKDMINILIGKHQLKYKISERLELNANTKNLPINNDLDLKKFLPYMNIGFRGRNQNEKEVQLDYYLYSLLMKVKEGYRPNIKDKNLAIRFTEFINHIEQSGSKDEELIITEKNREDNKKYKLEYSEEFEQYRFMEM